MKGKKLTTLILILIFVVGLSLMLYPTVSDYWNSFHQSRAIASYSESVNANDEETNRQMLEQAQKFNEELKSKSNRFVMSDEELESYYDILNVSGTGIMGYIDIPLIDVSLPIYHGLDESVLQIAVGHIEGSSFPIGGKGTHAVLSAHRGLPSARLFTDLDKLGKGDVFMVHVLDQTVTYEVDQIVIVEPEQLDELAIDPEMDYCTLVTCTPYGINSHRMLVRGHRIENLPDTADIHVASDAIQIEPVIVAPIVAIPILIILLILVMFTTRKKGK